MGLFDRFRKNKKQAEQVRNFRANLLEKGRLTDATITDNETLDTGETLVHYYYTVQGALFESSEILNEEQLKNSVKYAPGAVVGVRYDPKHHGSSVLV